ncbi:DUF3048 domain-containing protein [Streptomyces sp. N2-109]|uniref:DUF3048 domain-containing protein n=1 Tax=Streptomyces gossypii TaxID=2883101 RepID=A0ABT2JRW6_9ACTN|nr:DUF3048 domain-containing protein [Streptomyces gossypii]MCT2589989.1 DUF3048 domain-containing protein [Streptomyces gossypii]
MAAWTAGRQARDTWTAQRAAPTRRARGQARRAARRLLALTAAALLCVTAACDTSEDDSQRDPHERDQAPTHGRSPFTDVSGRLGPVLAVKIDNAPGARPPTGLEKADLVFVEQVEGGSSRLMAVYSRRLPDSVGPVRSARESDIELLGQFGRPALAYSGVRSALQDDLRRAPVRRLPPSKAPAAYSRSDTRAAPHNLFLRPEEALRSAPGVSAPRDIGFRFGAAPAGGEPAAQHTVRYPAASFRFDWSPGEGRWLVSMDGTAARTADGERLGAPTVIEQRVTVRASRFRDVAGAVTPYIETVGTGKATVLRDGKAYATEWKRPTDDSGTTYTLPEGDERMTFARGPVWVVYTAR